MRRVGRKSRWVGYVGLVVSVLSALLIVSGCALSPYTGIVTAPTRVVATASSGATPSPCSGAPLATDPLTPSLILTTQQSGQTAQARVGEVIEVRLPVTQRWEFDAQGMGAPLISQNPQGSPVASLRMCVWGFQAAQTGSATLRFTGTMLCDPNSPCAAYAIALNYTIKVS